MNKIQHIFLILISLYLVSCGNIDSLFEVRAESQFRIELGLNTLEAHYFRSTDVLIPYTTQLNGTGLVQDDITKFIASRAELRPKFGEQMNLDFINSVNVYILDPTDFNRRKEIFYIDFVEIGQANEIRLFNALNDITEFLVNDRAVIETRLEFRQFPPSSFDMRLDMTFSALAEE